MKITRHANNRIKERVGLPKRAHLRHVQNVLRAGDLVSKKTSEGFKMVYQGFLYIFASSKYDDEILVTTYEAPSNNCIAISDFKSKKK